MGASAGRGERRRQGREAQAKGDTHNFLRWPMPSESANWNPFMFRAFMTAVWSFGKSLHLDGSASGLICATQRYLPKVITSTGCALLVAGLLALTSWIRPASSAELTLLKLSPGLPLAAAAADDLPLPIGDLFFGMLVLVDAGGRCVGSVLRLCESAPLPSLRPFGSKMRCVSRRLVLPSLRPFGFRSRGAVKM